MKNKRDLLKLRYQAYIIIISIISFSSCTKVKHGFSKSFKPTIVFSHDFEDNTLGEYKSSEWESDWNFPRWSNRNIPPEIIQLNDPLNQTKAMRWYFPEGALGPSEGGGQWWSPLDSVYKELYFSYRVKFKPGFDWVLGGKLPGVRGGPEWEGFDPPGYDDGFIVLLMWNKYGNINFYYYHQDQDHTYGNSDTWDCTLQPGNWHKITIRIVMNSVTPDGGLNNGILEGFFDDKLVCQLTNLRFRNYEDIGVEKLYVTSFFGGGDDEWASTRDEWLDIDDFVVYYYSDNSGTVVGNIPSKINQNNPSEDF